MTLLSVIVPVHNTEQYLRRCLDSLLDQDLDASDYEIFVVDDGSKDSSLSIAWEYADEHPNITVRSQVNQGCAVVRNATIPDARGRYLFFYDSDDYLAPQSLGGLVRTACRLNADVLAFEHTRVDPGEATAVPPVTIPDHLEVKRGIDYVADHRYLSESTCYLYDRTLVTELGARYDEGHIVEDIVFTATVVCAAERLVHVPVPFYFYVQRPGSIMNSSDDEHTVKLVED